MNILVELNRFGLLVTFVLNLGLAFYVFFYSRRNEASRSFLWLLLAISTWVGGFFAFSLVHSPEWLLFWRKFTPLGASLIASSFVYFSLVFPHPLKPLNFWQKALIFAPGMTLGFLSIFTNLIIRGYVIFDPYFPFLGKPLFGPWYWLFSLHFISYFLGGTFLLVYKYLKLEGIEKAEVGIVLLGIFLSSIFAVITSLWLPLFGISKFFITGPLFVLFFVIFVFYAIFRYRLFNLVEFATQGIFLLGLVTVSVATLIGFLTKNFSFLLHSYVAIANVVLGAVVYVKDPRNPVNRYFALLVFFISFWTLANYFSDVSKGMEEAIFWNRMIYFVSSLIPIASVLFALHFPQRAVYIKKSQIWWLVSLGIAISLLSLFTDLLVKSITFVDSRTEIGYGPLFVFHSLYLLGGIGFALFHLWGKYQRSTGTAKAQLGYVFLGFVLSSFLAIITNIVLPAFGYFKLTPFGPSFMLIMVGSLAYAILKHRLMSIEVVIQRSTVYALSTIFIMALYALAVMISEVYLRGIIGYTSLLITALAALAIAVVYQPLVRFLQNLTDRLFFRGRYDYQKTLREISGEIASVIKLEELAKLVVSSFIDTMKVSEVSFLLPEKEGEHFISVFLPLSRYKRIEIDIKSPIISWLLSSKDILVREEIEEEIMRQEALGKEGEERRQSLEEVRDEMDRLGISLWIPVISKGELIGIIALGEKISGEIFTTEDLALLTTLANQIAVALENARLYEEVVSMKDYSEEILQSMTNGVLTTDINGRIVTFNQMAEKITGRKAREVLGKTCEEIWGKRGAITVAVENSLKDRCYLNFETSVVSPERGLVPVSFSSTLLRDVHGKRIGALLSIHDLTEIKALENKLRQADKLSALATMAAGMAHEIKNPLSSMKIFSQLLPQKIDDPEFRRKLQEILPREIDRIDRIVESLLGFARATAPTFEKAKIEDILEATLKDYEDQAKNAGVIIKRDYAALPEIEVDRNQISQVFSNLILNAIQAMPEGGELLVATFAGKKVDDTVQEVKIKISDTGHGIPEDMIKKLFDPFFTTKYGGTGLGLTITHSIVDGHKGSIDVESKVGKGTTFTVTLPVSQG